MDPQRRGITTYEKAPVSGPTLFWKTPLETPPRGCMETPTIASKSPLPGASGGGLPVHPLRPLTGGSSPDVVVQHRLPPTVAASIPEHLELGTQADNSANTGSAGREGSTTTGSRTPGLSLALNRGGAPRSPHGHFPGHLEGSPGGRMADGPTGWRDCLAGW